MSTKEPVEAHREWKNVFGRVLEELTSSDSRRSEIALCNFVVTLWRLCWVLCGALWRLCEERERERDR